MTDDIDRAQARDLQYQADCERERRYRAARPGLPYTGNCHYCGAITGGGRRFCDADCRDAWDRERRLKQMQGVN